jgi:multidrug resistance efflux pump
MELLLLAIYSGIVWLIFFKYKLLPWTFISQVVVITIPIVGMAVLILLLNVVAPSSHDVRVINYVVQVVPQVSGQIVEVPVQDNSEVKTGDVLFRIDSIPFALKVRQLEAELQNSLATAGQLSNTLTETQGNTAALRTQLDLAQKRVKQYTELVAAGAGQKFDLEQAQNEVDKLRSQIAAAEASEQKVHKRLGARVGGDQAEVAEIRARLAQARWELDKTTVLATGDGYAINVQIRPGTYAAALPLRPVMTLVLKHQQVYALYTQNELSLVAPGNEAEFTVRSLPGKLMKARVKDVIWAQGQGQMAPSGDLPSATSPQAPGRFAVELEPEDSTVFLAAGARGQGAIYTDHLKIIHLVRKVIIRVGAKTDYLVLKLH